jgi:hypothetical protein
VTRVELTLVRQAAVLIVIMMALGLLSSYLELVWQERRFVREVWDDPAAYDVAPLLAEAARITREAAGDA